MNDERVGQLVSRGRELVSRAEGRRQWTVQVGISWLRDVLAELRKLHGGGA